MTTFARSKGVWPIAGAVLIGSLFTAPLVPLFDPDEGYYPATAAESIDAGSAWDLRFNGGPRWEKPPLAYSLIQVSFALFGRSIAAARAPSALQAVALTLIIAWLVARLATRRAACLAAGVVATTLGIQIFSRAAHPEIAVVLGIATAQLLIASWIASPDRNRRPAIAAAIGLAIGYGALAKGPVAIVLPAVTAIAAIALTRRHEVWPAVGAAAIAAVTTAMVVLPWYVAMTERHGMTFLREGLWRQNVGRYAGAAFGHDTTHVWFYVLPTLVVMMPWTAFLPAALRCVTLSSATTRDILRITMAVAALAAFIFYSLSASRLPHYVLVLTPPLGILIALYLDERFDHIGEREFRASAILLAAAGIAIATTPFLVRWFLTPRELLGGVAGSVADLQSLLAFAVAPFAVLSIAAAIVVWGVKGNARLLALIAAGVLGPAALIAGAGPLLREVYPWERFGATIRGSNLPVWQIGPRSPSLTFHAGRPVTRLNAAQVAERLRPPAAAWVVADDKELETIRRRIARGSLTVVDRSGSMALAQAMPR